MNAKSSREKKQYVISMVMTIEFGLFLTNFTQLLDNFFCKKV